MNKLFKIISIITISTLLLMGCSQRKIDVGYTIYPVQYLLEEIGQERVETHALTNKRMVVRSQPKADYKEVLDKVDTLFIMGELEPYLDVINQDIIDKDTNIIDLSIKSGVFNFQRNTKVNVDNQIVDVQSNYYENPIFDTIDTYNSDPYLWLDPITMTSMANQVKAYLIEKDPDNTDFYQKNFNELKIKLAYLDSDYLSLRKDENFRFATMTPSYGIWQNNYNYSISPIILSKYGVVPTKQQLELIKVRIANDGSQYLIIDDILDDDVKALANELAEDLDLEKVVLSNLAFRSKEDVDEKYDYIDIMNKNLNILKELDKDLDEELDNAEE